MRLDQAIKQTKDKLYHHGRRFRQENWQSQKAPDDTWELLHHTVKGMIPSTMGELVVQTKIKSNWAELQFQERVGGIPLNPGYTFDKWPGFVQRDNATDRDANGQFSHTYMERFWPKRASLTSGIMTDNHGIRYSYGDFQDVINLLEKDPTTRQAYLPIFFPEDTGTHHGERVPCTLGYRFIQRDGMLDITYDIRSCDFLRHFRDDVYMACRLVQFMLQVLKEHSSMWEGIKPGRFIMNITSLHVFASEKELLSKNNT